MTKHVANPKPSRSRPDGWLPRRQELRTLVQAATAFPLGYDSHRRAIRPPTPSGDKGSHTDTVGAGYVREHEGTCRPGRQRRAVRHERERRGPCGRASRRSPCISRVAGRVTRWFKMPVRQRMQGWPAG
jgi:hypothetical protein